MSSARAENIVEFMERLPKRTVIERINDDSRPRSFQWSVSLQGGPIALGGTVTETLNKFERMLKAMRAM